MSAALGQRAAELHKHGGRHVCTLHGGSQSRALVSKTHPHAPGEIKMRTLLPRRRSAGVCLRLLAAEVGTVERP